MASDRWVGMVLGGRYQITGLLGQGGMSAVYKAEDPNLQRPVAIKLIHPHLTNNPEFVRRFESEATAIARLRHPNIVQVFDLNHDGDIFYMVLEYVAGETLQSRIKRLNDTGRQLPIRDALRFTIQVCNAADYAHQRGMIHRDIKPANVMLDVNGNAILMDFGIARMVEGHQHTATGTLLGTALYMSPEQIQGLHPDARSDIYSIGVMLFEALGGRPPFEADSAMTLMMMHMNDPVPDLNQLQPGIPEEVKAIVNHALEKNRANRFQSCTEMAEALQRALDTLGDSTTTPAPSYQKEARPAPSNETVIEPAPRAQSLKTIIEPVPSRPAYTASQSTIIETPAARAQSPARLAEAIPQAPPTSHKKTIFFVIAAVLVLSMAGGGFFFYDQIMALVAPPKTVVAGISPTTTVTQPVAPTSTIPATATTEPSPVPSPTITVTPSPTETPVIVPTASATVPAALVIGGADKIAYLFENNIWVANVDGSEMQQITSDGTPKKYLRWLPGGQGLSYIVGLCIQTVDLNGTAATITCFNSATYLDSFEVSPDGTRVALSVDRQLYLLPFDLERLSKADSHPDLAGMADCPAMAPYQRNAATSARWSKDGKLLAAVTLGVLANERRGDVVQVFAVDRCIADPAVKIQFPQPHFNFGEYNQNPSLAGFTWDGDFSFAMNGITRNEGFGELQLFNRNTYKAISPANPIDGSCCYRDPMFSPDGTYLLFAFQDIRLGADSKTMLYYIPYGTIGAGAKYQPLPLQEYTNPREAPQPVARPAVLP